ncbi:unnamed protein product [marine sediment metagenome]|uniref:Uncharacterized protein n=1 Tax=marine sediment metagenome TaxID=412755 RepID=X0XP27_9ZZZZ
MIPLLSTLALGALVGVLCQLYIRRVRRAGLRVRLEKWYHGGILKLKAGEYIGRGQAVYIDESGKARAWPPKKPEGGPDVPGQ